MKGENMMISFKPIDKNTLASSYSSDMTAFTPEDINQIILEAARIQIDLSRIVFSDSNDASKLHTHYDFEMDRLYVPKKVIPSTQYLSCHPRDVMSITASLAREYYGHRLYRDEYLSDLKKGENYHSLPHWQDECRASITAAKITPNLSRMERSYLFMDAAQIAEEAGYVIELDDYMKNILFVDYYKPDIPFVPEKFKIHFVNRENQEKENT